MSCMHATCNMYIKYKLKMTKFTINITKVIQGLATLQKPVIFKFITLVFFTVKKKYISPFVLKYRLLYIFVLLVYS
jgi:hypothetical protein